MNRDIRDIKPWEMSVVQDMAYFLDRIDSLVFSADPITKIKVFTGLRHQETGAKIGYTSADAETGNPEHYRIYAFGIHKYFRRLISRRLVWPAPDGLIATITWSSGRTIDEIMSGLAAHEVRHRVQCLLRPTLFSLSRPDEAPQGRQIMREYQELPSKTREHYQGLSSPGINGEDMEFDAIVIASLVLEELHLWMKNEKPGEPDEIAERIRQIILSGT